ncbi:hypothetical protein SAMN05421805_10152 [Saccharopolyspora antimicrobica]|uniref:Uncharacterized protein n=1 Tax=Saccharopolyspora antimicrobica TaxID=455193 RepID=A0A1I4QBB1_9PSEU|nr:hypothetical protein [Saccharopolyspora antimicrobica]RKT84859.1 hypothetical protein ATL45_3190 [Saccharopolyspora antimicrobica]SFM37391.1 hypothetical protein SAMN05421805_10152 [Saccharopolyspora antimicrobica]
MTPSDLASAALIPAIIVVTLGYFVTCAIWPFKACRACHGEGKFRSPFLRSFRLCTACKATGLRLRAGRKAYNALRRLARANRRR